MKTVHRVIYEAKHGPVPKGKELDHKCRVRCCCNPDHVEPVTHRENVRRGNAGWNLGGAPRYTKTGKFKAKEKGFI